MKENILVTKSRRKMLFENVQLQGPLKGIKKKKTKFWKDVFCSWVEKLNIAQILILCK